METIQNPKKIEVSLEIKDNIFRVWTIAKDHEKISKLNSNMISPVTYEKGTNSYTLGSVFTFVWYGVSTFKYTCTEVISLDYFKKIKWEATADIFECKLYFISSLFANTLDNTTLIIFTTEFENPEVICFTQEMIIGYKDLFLGIIKKINDYLKSSVDDLEEYESIIISNNRERIWEYVTDWNKLKNVSNLMGDDVQYSGDALKIGTVLTVLCPQKNGTISYLKVTGVENDKDSYQWRYTLECFAGKPKALRQVVQFCICKITDSTCFVSFSHKFLEPVKTEELKKMATMKKEILQQLKTFLDIEN